MRQKLTHLGLCAALGIPLVLGCHLLPKGRDPVKPPVANDRKADVPSLVNFMNQNAQRMQNLRCRVDLDCKQGKQAIGLGGRMACQKPRDFRLQADVLGQPAVDVGSNTNEFWYWIKQANPPYVYHCSYRDLATGKVNVPFPFQPDMVFAALGMAEYDPEGRYELKESPRTLELVQDTVSPSGQKVKRTTVFNRFLSKPGEPQILAHLLRDERGNVIAKAEIKRVETDRTSGATVPTQVVLEWPAQQVSMKLFVSNLEVNSVNKELADRLFTRTNLNSYDSFDLARGVVDTPGGVRRAAGATLLPPRR